MPKLTIDHVLWAICDHINGIERWSFNLWQFAQRTHQELETSRTTTITVGDDTCKNSFNPQKINPRILAAPPYIRDIQQKGWQSSLQSVVASYYIWKIFVGLDLKWTWEAPYVPTANCDYHNAALWTSFFAQLLLFLFSLIKFLFFFLIILYVRVKLR